MFTAIDGWICEGAGSVCIATTASHRLPQKLSSVCLDFGWLPRLALKANKTFSIFGVAAAMVWCGKLSGQYKQAHNYGVANWGDNPNRPVNICSPPHESANEPPSCSPAPRPRPCHPARWPCASSWSPVRHHGNTTLLASPHALDRSAVPVLLTWSNLIKNKHVKDNITNKTSYKWKGLLVTHVKARRSCQSNKTQISPWAIWRKMATTMEREMGKDVSLDGCARARRDE
jgi:hypothetical protein